MKFERVSNTIYISNLTQKEKELFLNIVPKLIQKYGYQLQPNDVSTEKDSKCLTFTLIENYPDLSGFSSELIRTFASKLR